MFEFNHNRVKAIIKFDICLSEKTGKAHFSKAMCQIRSRLIRLINPVNYYQVEVIRSTLSLGNHTNSQQPRPI